MAEQAVRVVLLARAGNARDQLHRALSDLGAELVAEGDPAELDPTAVAARSPNLVIISIEPAIEAALDRFDDLLAMPGVDVMYDDAEVTRALDGWDLNRWARHLAAKLLGRDVLPPPPEGNAGIATPTVQAPAAASPASAAEPMGSAAHGMPVEFAAVESVSVGADVEADLPMPSIGLDFDQDDLAQAISRIDAGSSGQAEAAPAPANTSSLDDFVFEADLSSLDQQLGTTFSPNAEASAPGLDVEFKPQAGGFSQFDTGDDSTSDLDADVAALAAQLDALAEKVPQHRPQDPDFARATMEFDKPATSSPPGRSGAPAAPAAPKLDFNSLSLTPMDEAPAASRPAPSFDPIPRAPISQLLGSGLNLTLETIDDELAGNEAHLDSAGAVLILAGLGGPDAVRQLLKALPARLPVPVLLFQHLEVGNHDRLVSQLAKVSAWPVYLGGTGMRAQRGQVGVIPHGMGVVVQGTTLHFAPVASQRQMIENLSAADSMVFLLSGADPEAVPAALALQQQGGMAMAQNPDGCFDPAAAQALLAGGGSAGDASTMAQRLATRWA